MFISRTIRLALGGVRHSLLENVILYCLHYLEVKCGWVAINIREKKNFGNMSPAVILGCGSVNEASWILCLSDLPLGSCRCLFCLLTSGWMPAFFQMMSFKQVLVFSFLFFWFPAACWSVAAEAISGCLLPICPSWVLASMFWQGTPERQAVVQMLRGPALSSFSLKVIFPSAFTFVSWFPLFLSLKIPSTVDKGWCLLSKAVIFSPQNWPLEWAPFAVGLPCAQLAYIVSRNSSVWLQVRVFF